jgi:hypothetical protein
MKEFIEFNKLKQIVSESKSLREVIIKSNRNDSSSMYRSFKKLIDYYGIDTSHFLSKKEIIKKNFIENKIPHYSNDEIFKLNSKVSRTTLKKRIIRDNIFKYECVFCGNPGEWMGKKISLILDHINGYRNDNRLENLRFLCPNCNSTLPTHCQGWNYKEKSIESKKNKRKYHERPSQRKVKRPSKEELKKMLSEENYCKIGRKYGVSDNAVRNWARYYGLIENNNNKK